MADQKQGNEPSPRSKNVQFNLPTPTLPPARPKLPAPALPETDVKQEIKISIGPFPKITVVENNEIPTKNVSFSNGKITPSNSEKMTPRNSEKMTPRNSEKMSPRNNSIISPRNNERLSPTRKSPRKSPRNDSAPPRPNAPAPPRPRSASTGNSLLQRSLSANDRNKFWHVRHATFNGPNVPGRGTLLKQGYLEFLLKSWLSVPAKITTEYIEVNHPEKNVIIFLLDIFDLEVDGATVKLRRITSPQNNMTETFNFRIVEDEERASWLEHIVAWSRAGCFSSDCFSPVRSNINARAFVGGSEYYPVLADAMENAKEEILIADWWLTPEIYLKRHPIEEAYRLDNLLRRKADQRVRIKIIVYCEIPKTVELGSERVKNYLQGLSPYIDVVRAPYRPPGSANPKSLFNTHHQKFVVIDRQVAFIGGIDLCFGRYNVHGSTLVDVEGAIFPGLDYYNPTYQSPTCLENAFSDAFDRTLYPRMPWQDVQICVDGEAAKDVALNFIQRWNIERLRRGRRESLMLADFISTDPEEKGDLIVHVLSCKDVKAADLNGLSDPYCIVSMKQGSASIRERREIDKSPIVSPTLNPVWDVDFYFPYRASVNEPITIFIKVYDADFGMADDFLGRVDIKLDKNFPFGQKQTLDLLKEKEDKKSKGTIDFIIDYEHPNGFTKLDVPELSSGLKCQVLRSVSNWSCGSASEESSIYAQYLKIIQDAEHFIYIESQFFISDTGTSKSAPIKNKISSTIGHRVIRAYEEKQKFRVIIIVPLHPEGTVLDSTTQAVMYWQYRTILRNGRKSLYGMIRKSCPDIKIDDYISFYSLYNHGLLSGKIVSNQIYVHTKLIIVDDKKLIMGSQNINDRSLRGTRDSEIAVMIHEDTNTVDVEINGQNVKVSKFVQNFRLQLWKEHLGISEMESLEKEYLDVTNDSVYYDRWYNIAKKNTEIYSEVFPNIPQNSISKVIDLTTRDKEPKNTEQLQFIHGNLIFYPIHFLTDENLRHILSDRLFQ